MKECIALISNFLAQDIKLQQMGSPIKVCFVSSMAKIPAGVTGSELEI
jgi:hypothetical protein